MEPDEPDRTAQLNYDMSTRHGKASARHRMASIDLEIANLQNEKATLRNELMVANAKVK